MVRKGVPVHGGRIQGVEMIERGSWKGRWWVTKE